MRDHDPLDAAQLYRLEVGDGAYFAFLERQFVTRSEDGDLLTRPTTRWRSLPLSELHDELRRPDRGGLRALGGAL